MSSQIILHGRRLHLSSTQADRLSSLLARPGQLISEGDLQHPVLQESSAALAKAISRLREVIRPHGYAIYRVVGHGFLLVEEEEEEIILR
jgi:DNA-binding response OmpR family regulator